MFRPGPAVTATVERSKLKFIRMTTSPAPVHRIQLRLRELAQLFNSMDPTPFHHKDLDPEIDLKD